MNASAQRLDQVARGPTEEQVAALREIQETEVELAEYRLLVQNVADAGDGKVIFNRSVAHASIVIANIFRCSNSTVDIMTGSLDPAVFCTPEVIYAAEYFVSAKSGQVRVISEIEIPVDHSLMVAMAASASNAAVQIDKKVFVSPSDRLAFHFALGDSRNFRLEPDKSKTEAYAQFGEPDIGQELQLTFDRLWNAFPT